MTTQSPGSQAKPFDTYFGGKAGSGTYQTIINQIPPHEIYLEWFVGGGAIYRHKQPAHCNILVDRDETVVQAWMEQGLPQKFLNADCGKGSHIVHDDATRLLTSRQTVLDREDAFFYVDPPYPLSTRKSDTRYAHELTDDDHRQLLSILDRYKHARIAISTYPNTLYGTMLADWRRIEFESTTRNGMATEWLFMNYPEPTELHDYRYVGKDYRERERIAKKVRRHVRKFNALPELERKALLAALLRDRQ